MTQVNPPIAQLSRVDFNSVQGKKFLIDLLNQMWERVGGSEDIVGNNDAVSSTISARLNARINDVEAEASALRGEMATVRSLLNGITDDLRDNQKELQGMKGRCLSQLHLVIDKLNELEGLI